VNLGGYRRAFADPSVLVVSPKYAVATGLKNFLFFIIAKLTGAFHFLFSEVDDYVCNILTQNIMGGQNDLPESDRGKEPKKACHAVTIASGTWLVQDEQTCVGYEGLCQCHADRQGQHVEGAAAERLDRTSVDLETVTVLGDDTGFSS
jgi:hypothetical protein